MRAAKRTPKREEQVSNVESVETMVTTMAMRKLDAHRKIEKSFPLQNPQSGKTLSDEDSRGAYRNRKKLLIVTSGYERKERTTNGAKEDGT